jgi:UDP-3-O-[3-hydroxymyristoyl] glucosamine N-acyltransferase
MSEQPSITVAELARRLNANLEGDGARAVREVAPLERAGPQAVSWLGDPRYLPQLAQTSAAVVLVPADCEVPVDRTVIRVPDPDVALCEVLRCLAPPSEPLPVGVHATAVIGKGAVAEGAAVGAHVYVGPHAVVGAGTQLHSGVHVGAHTKVGRNCVLWPNVVVRERVTIGDRVIIHPNATIGADGFGYLQRDGRHLKIPQIGTVVVEDDVEIGANSAIDRARSGETRIRRGTKIDNLVQIGHNCDIGEDCIIVGQCGISGSTMLGRYVVLGGQVGIVDHVRIGTGAQAGAQAGITHDVPDGQKVRGYPATEQHLFARQQVIIRRLPKMVEQLRELYGNLNRQRTIQKEAELSGRGLFTGFPVRLRFKPAAPGSGITFVRCDQPEPVRIAARVENLTKRARRTSLRNGTTAIETVEHCLAAICGLSIDNLEIELDNAELPAADGSSVPFVEVLKAAGVAEQDAERHCFQVPEVIRVSDGDAELVAWPGDGERLDIIYELDYGPDSAVGRQIERFSLSRDGFIDEIAPARTFVTEEEARKLQAAGLGKHLTYQDILVIGHDGPIDNRYRLVNECVRHKILDLVGDLVLLGCFVSGRIYARKSGHNLNHPAQGRREARHPRRAARAAAPLPDVAGR